MDRRPGKNNMSPDPEVGRHNLPNMPGNNPILGLVLSISIAHTNLVKFYQLVLKILSRDENLTSIKGHNSITNFQIMTG